MAGSGANGTRDGYSHDPEVERRLSRMFNAMQRDRDGNVLAAPIRRFLQSRGSHENAAVRRALSRLSSSDAVNWEQFQDILHPVMATFRGQSSSDGQHSPHEKHPKTSGGDAKQKAAARESNAIANEAEELKAIKNEFRNLRGRALAIQEDRRERKETGELSRLQSQVSDLENKVADLVERLDHSAEEERRQEEEKLEQLRAKKEELEEKQQRLEEQRRERVADIQNDKEHLEQEVEALYEQIAQESQQHEQSKSEEEEALEQEVSRLENQKEEVREKEEEARRLREEEIASLEAELDQKQRERQSLAEQSESLQKEISELSERKAGIKSKADFAESDRQWNEERANRLRSKAEEQREEVTNAESHLQECEAARDNAAERLAEAEATEAAEREHLESLRYQVRAAEQTALNYRSRADSTLEKAEEHRQSAREMQQAFTDSLNALAESISSGAVNSALASEAENAERQVEASLDKTHEDLRQAEKLEIEAEKNFENAKCRISLLEEREKMLQEEVDETCARIDQLQSEASRLSYEARSSNYNIEKLSEQLSSLQADEEEASSQKAIAETEQRTLSQREAKLRQRVRALTNANNSSWDISESIKRANELGRETLQKQRFALVDDTRLPAPQPPHNDDSPPSRRAHPGTSTMRHKKLREERESNLRSHQHESGPSTLHQPPSRTHQRDQKANLKKHPTPDEELGGGMHGRGSQERLGTSGHPTSQLTPSRQETHSRENAFGVPTSQSHEDAASFPAHHPQQPAIDQDHENWAEDGDWAKFDDDWEGSEKRASEENRYNDGANQGGAHMKLDAGDESEPDEGNSGMTIHIFRVEMATPWDGKNDPILRVSLRKEDNSLIETPREVVLPYTTGQMDDIIAFETSLSAMDKSWSARFEVFERGQTHPKAQGEIPVERLRPYRNLQATLYIVRRRRALGRGNKNKQEETIIVRFQLIG